MYSLPPSADTTSRRNFPSTPSRTSPYSFFVSRLDKGSLNDFEKVTRLAASDEKAAALSRHRTAVLRTSARSTPRQSASASVQASRKGET
jgi:hypothetical protein